MKYTEFPILTNVFKIWYYAVLEGSEERRSLHHYGEQLGRAY